MENSTHARGVPRTQGFYPPVASANRAVNGAQLNPGQTFESKRTDQPPLTEPTSANPPFRSPRNTIQCYLVCAVIFIFYSRFFDVYLTQYRIPAITLGLTALASLFSGHLLQSLQYRVSKLPIPFTGL